jgi:hypothetical protein
VTDNRGTSYGAGFNSNGGGVHAMLWTSSGVEVFYLILIQFNFVGNLLI